MNRSSIVLVLFLVLYFHSFSATAQEIERGETLSIPAVSEHTAGHFSYLNALPESIRKSAVFGRLLHEYTLNASEDGFIDVEARLKSIEQSRSDLLRDAVTSYKSLGSKVNVFANAWQNIGPSTSTTTAGCTKALAIDPTNADVLYAGGAAGGIWKTTNATAASPSWVSLTDLVIPDLAIASIAIDPSNPNTLYVGSGDPALAIDGLGGSGLYKSRDAGATWARIATTTFSKTVNKVFVHPTDSNVVFACNYESNKGLYRSANAGTSFTKVFPTIGSAQGVIWDIVPAQTINGKLILYMVEGNNGGTSSTECGIYQSLDDGLTWTKLATNGVPVGNLIGKSALAIPKNTLSTVYCLISDPNGDLTGLYRSINSGSQFSKITTVPTTLFNPSPGQTSPQGWYDLYLGVGPGANGTDTIYIGGVEAYRSFNNGASWSSYSDYKSHFNIHVDHQCIAINPFNSTTVWIGTDGGVYRSLDAGNSWNYKSSGMMTMRAYHIALDNSEFKRTYSGFQDQGIWKTQSGAGATFMGFGDGFQPIVDPTNSNIMYGESPNGDLAKTTNGGSNFFDINSSSFEAQTDWDTPFKMAPHNNQILFTGRQKLWRSTNSGSSWSPISGTFYSGTTIKTIGLSPANSNMFWLGFNGGNIVVTTNGGANWSGASNGIPSNTSVRSIVCHPLNQKIALVGLSATSTNNARVMRTTDAGANWSDVSGSSGHNLPGTTVNCVAIDSVDPLNVWYAATNNGIYYTLDAGQTWSIAGSGIGLAPCFDVQIHSNKVTIRVGTHGRSIWEANVNILPVELTGLTATATSKGTQLHWKTDSEFNTFNFVVERSYNYQPFEVLGTVPGAGNSNTVKEYNFFDAKTTTGYYIFRLRIVDLDGSEHLSNTVDVSYGGASSLRLDQNFPNPFIASEMPTSRIQFFLPQNQLVSLMLFSADGKIVRRFIDHEFRASGEQDINFDATDDAGNALAGGTYYYTLETETNGIQTKKLILFGK